MSLIIFVLLVYGICNIIVFANGPFHIFKKMHEYFKERHPVLEELTSCMICLPTWASMFISAVNLLFFPMHPLSPMNLIIVDKTLWPIIIFLDGLIGSGANWLVNTFQEMMERSNDNSN